MVINQRKFLCQFIATDLSWILCAKEVLNLFTMCRFENFMILLNEFIVTFYKLFIISLQKFEYSLAFFVIESLTTFIRRAYTKIVSNSTEHMLPLEDIDKVSEVIEHLCKILINYMPFSFQAHVTVLRFYMEMIKIGNMASMKQIQLVPTDVIHLLLVNGSAVTFELYAKLIHDSFKLAEKRNFDKNHVTVIELSKQVQELYEFFFNEPVNHNMFLKPIVQTSVEYKPMIELTKSCNLFKIKSNIAFWHLTRLDENGQLREKAEFNINAFEKSCTHLIKLLSSVKQSRISARASTSSQK